MKVKNIKDFETSAIDNYKDKSKTHLYFCSSALYKLIEQTINPYSRFSRGDLIDKYPEHLMMDKLNGRLIAVFDKDMFNSKVLEFNLVVSE